MRKSLLGIRTGFRDGMPLVMVALEHDKFYESTTDMLVACEKHLREDSNLICILIQDNATEEVNVFVNGAFSSADIS